MRVFGIQHCRYRMWQISAFARSQMDKIPAEISSTISYKAYIIPHRGIWGFFRPSGCHLSYRFAASSGGSSPVRVVSFPQNPRRANGAVAAPLLQLLSTRLDPDLLSPRRCADAHFRCPRSPTRPASCSHLANFRQNVPQNLSLLICRKLFVVPFSSPAVSLSIRCVCSCMRNLYFSPSFPTLFP